ncbi:MAG: FMN-binding negative transcriptional regulator [bacterium]|nr:FMN-binding negative transcriptional regulator [bacterium]
MYIPRHFSEDDLDTLQTLMEQHNFAALVTQHEGQLFASHLPFMLDRQRGAYGTLIAHVAKANPQWQSLEGQEALVIFQGPHAYVSPSWYEAAPANVPTWNYAVAHAYGMPRIVESYDEMRAMLERLVREHETPFEHPWPLDWTETQDRMMGGTVGLEIEITRLEGKFKLSQNRKPEDHARVMEGLAMRENTLDQATAALMQEQKARAEAPEQGT